MSSKFLTFCVLLALSEAVRIRTEVSEESSYGENVFDILSRSLFKDYEYAPELKLKKKKVEGQDLSKIPGIAGHDYPIFHEFPETSFDCASVPAHPGIYANVETGCQVCSR